MRFPHNEPLALQQVRDGRRDSRVTAGTWPLARYPHSEGLAARWAPEQVRGDGVCRANGVNPIFAGGVA